MVGSRLHFPEHRAMRPMRLHRHFHVRLAVLLVGTFVGSLTIATTAVAQTDTATASASATLPTAQSLIDRHVAAIGGREALQRLRSYHQRASVEIAAIGLRGEGEIVAAAPNFTRTRMSVPGIGELVAGTNGPVAWTINPIQGPRVLSEAEMPQSREQSDFYGTLLFPADRYATMETMGRVEFNGQPAYKVRLVRKDGARESLRYFSVESGLLIGSESSSTSDMGTFRTTLAWSDYRSFGALRFPTRSESNAGTSRLIITIQSMTFDDVDPAVFALPAAVKALIQP